MITEKIGLSNVNFCIFYVLIKLISNFKLNYIFVLRSLQFAIKELIQFLITKLNELKETRTKKKSRNRGNPNSSKRNT